jgi:hypothetical protein
LENPLGYENVLLHMKMHKDMDMQMQMQQVMASAPPPTAPQSSGEEGASTGEPLQDGQNAPTVQ